MEATQVRSLLHGLAGSRFHGWAPDVEVDWGLNVATLDLLVDLVHPGDRTLETGVGQSTVVFAARGARHTVVSPFAFEHDRVKEWCSSNDIDLSSVSFVIEPSQSALPKLDAEPLELMLIDGDHAFPSPFIDFHYGAGRVVPGGLVVIDDIHIRTCAVLADFVRFDTPRWRVHTELPTTLVAERLEGPFLPPEGWQAQPWGASVISPTRMSRTWMRTRNVVRARSRLRALGRVVTRRPGPSE